MKSSLKRVLRSRLVVRLMCELVNVFARERSNGYGSTCLTDIVAVLLSFNSSKHEYGALKAMLFSFMFSFLLPLLQRHIFREHFLHYNNGTVHHNDRKKRTRIYNNRSIA